MKAFSGFKAEKRATREQLPVGGYVAKILNVEEINYDWASFLKIDFDIVDDQYKDFFKKDYSGQQTEDKKWHGNFRLRIPADDGTEQDGWHKRSFGNAMWAVENSNPGYHWDWNEATLKGKEVGVLFRNEEWEYNGNTGWRTACCALTSVEDIKNGTFKMPKDKPLKGKAPAALPTAFKPIEEDTELPWL